MFTTIAILFVIPYHHSPWLSTAIVRQASRWKTMSNSHPEQPAWRRKTPQGNRARGPQPSDSVVISNNSWLSDLGDIHYRFYKPTWEVIISTIPGVYPRNVHQPRHSRLGAPPHTIPALSQKICGRFPTVPKGMMFTEILECLITFDHNYCCCLLSTTINCTNVVCFLQIFFFLLLHLSTAPT